MALERENSALSAISLAHTFGIKNRQTSETVVIFDPQDWSKAFDRETNQCPVSLNIQYTAGEGAETVVINVPAVLSVDPENHAAQLVFTSEDADAVGIFQGHIANGLSPFADKEGRPRAEVGMRWTFTYSYAQESKIASNILTRRFDSTPPQRDPFLDVLEFATALQVISRGTFSVSPRTSSPPSVS